MQASTAPIQLSSELKLDAAPTNFYLWGDNGVDPGRAIDPAQETVVLTSGFTVNPLQSQWLTEMAGNIRSRNPNTNIVIADWDNRSTLNYAQIAVNVDAAGRDISSYLQGSGVNPNTLTLIGHSLGAQVAGVTGQYMNGSPKLIVGLDPAGLIFDALPGNMRLSPGDAQRVVALHTSRTFGSNLPLGDLDVFVNPNSLFQPGAWNASDNHRYAPVLLNELLNGSDYGGLTWEQLNNPNATGIQSADTTGMGRPMQPIAQPQFISAFTMWDWWERVMKYRNNQTGEFISTESEQQVSTNLTNQIRGDIFTIAKLLQDGKINLGTWEGETAQALKKLHIQQAILARGGADRMTREDYLAIGRILKEEYAYLRQLSQDLRDGKLTPAMLRFRLSMYTSRSRRSYEVMKQQNVRDTGYKYMERVLAFHDRHCSECITYANQGRQPIGTLPLPTEKCSCRANCTCSVRYFREVSD